MSIKVKVLLRLLLLSLCVVPILSACSDEDNKTSDWYQEVNKSDNEQIRKAKSIVNGMQGDLSMLDMSKTLGKISTRSNVSVPQTLKNGDFTLDWDVAQSYQEEDGEVLIVPIKMKQNTALWRFSIIDNKGVKEQTPLYSVLSVKTFKRTGHSVSRIFSYAPTRKHLKKFKQPMVSGWYDPRHTDYTGLFLVSTLDGYFLHAINYEAGHQTFIVRPNLSNSHEEHSVADSCQHAHTRSNVSDSSSVAAINSYFSMRTVTSASSIRTYSYDDETYEVSGCVFCGGDPNICDCLVVDYCNSCGESVDECTCVCSFCGENPCTCEYCDECQRLAFDCECSDGPTISGGGGSNGDNNNNGSGNNNNGGSQNNNNNSDDGEDNFAGNVGGDNVSASSYITGGTQEQRDIVKKIVDKLLEYNVNLKMTNIEIADNGCSSYARISTGYTKIEVCNLFFTLPERDQIAILWHEAYHLSNDDRTWVEVGKLKVDTYMATPPAEIDQAIKYILKADGLSEELYDEKTGLSISNPAWEYNYNQYITLSSYYINPQHTQNEINAYKAEMLLFPTSSVSQYYYYTRLLGLWIYETCLTIYY